MPRSAVPAEGSGPFGPPGAVVERGVNLPQQRCAVNMILGLFSTFFEKSFVQRISTLAARTIEAAAMRRPVLPDPAALGAAGERQPNEHKTSHGGKTARHTNELLLRNLSASRRPPRECFRRRLSASNRPASHEFCCRCATRPALIPFAYRPSSPMRATYKQRFTFTNF